MILSDNFRDKDKNTGIIANIERYALNDGFGVRSTVFFKGCPLHCKWCCNPETQEFKKELMFFPDNCIGCGTCINNCFYGALKDTATPDWNTCINCAERTPSFSCVSHCYVGCRKVSGEEMTAEEVSAVVKRDMNFYLKSGGGVTVSGGEPFLQPEFLTELLGNLKENWINTAIETCGVGRPEDLVSAGPYVDMVFFDLKCMDDKKHTLWTGSGNKQILDNFRLMVELAQKYSFELIARTPIIPGFNDSEEDIQAIGQFIKDIGDTTVAGYELLPYHKLGRSKYKALGRKYELEDLAPPLDLQMEKLNEAAGRLGVEMCKF